jgi:hypothetical protein
MMMMVMITYLIRDLTPPEVDYGAGMHQFC